MNLIDEKKNREKNAEFLKDQQILLKGTLLLLLRIMQKLIYMIFKMELIKLPTHNAKSNVLLRNYNTRRNYNTIMKWISKLWTQKIVKQIHMVDCH